MKKIFFFVIMFSITISAQWFWQNPLPTGARLKSVIFIDESIGWVAGFAGTIIKTTNGGNIWFSQSTGTDSHLFDIDFIDEYNGIAVGFSGSTGAIIQTKDGGETWSQFLFDYSYLYGCSFISEENIIAVGYDIGYSTGLIIYTTNGGETWNKFSIGPYKKWFSVCTSELSYITVVGSGGSILRTTDGGTNWVEQTSGTSDGLYAINFIDKNI